MINIEFSINILLLCAIVLVSAFVGYCFRSRQIRKKQYKIQELRKEIVYNHAQILELQKETVVLESKLKVTQAPVLPLITAMKDYEEGTQKVSDGSM